MTASESLYGPLFSTPAMDGIWSDENLVRTWLEAECAAARALDEHGMLEPGALDEILRAAAIEHIDFAALRDDTRANGMPIKPLVDQVVAAGGPLTKKYFHWGVTTQDVLDTGQALRLRASFDLLQSELIVVLQQICAQADRHRRSVMVARTNAQDASPTTWGLQVSTFASELIRHLERLSALRPRAVVGMLGGAVGTLAALGTHGMSVRRRMLELVDLAAPVGAWNGSQDGVAEVVHFAALVQGTLVRLANNIEVMGRTAVAEVRCVRSAGASSTMPHKSNPRDANLIQTCFQLAAMYAGQAVHLMDQTDVRSAAKRAASWVTVPAALRTLAAALNRTREMLDDLVVDEIRMRENFAHSRGFVMSEAVMFRLAEKVGRDSAYALVKTALSHACEADLFSALAQNEEVMSHLCEDELRAACDPMNYLGSVDALIDEVLEQARPWRVVSEK